MPVIVAFPISFTPPKLLALSNSELAAILHRGIGSMVPCLYSMAVRKVFDGFSLRIRTESCIAEPKYYSREESSVVSHK